ncbi:hypothetical protein F5Y19DRAFT_161780 [Xylariaceae sp. FL1651]|nr:hypothetical protein F5Y19DRAFT_161780 [Xylariaceae sp. FL1651]
MATLLEGWESDYDGVRWFYRYKATGMVQYHFPQPGDEFAGFLLDDGTEPMELTPEESLALEQQTKRRSITERDYDSKSTTKTSGSKREKKKIAAIEEEDGMSATGYFDTSSFMYSLGASNDTSPLGNDGENDSAHIGSSRKAKESTRNTAYGPTPKSTPPVPESEPIVNQPIGHVELAGESDPKLGISTSNSHPGVVELPEGGQQMWSPVGYVAELATQDTVKCAEELAPIELDATSFVPAPIETKVAQDERAELPTHRTPVEEKAPEPRPNDNTTQTVDDSAPSGTDLPAARPVPQSLNPVNNGPNKYQPWSPAQGTVEQPSQKHDNTSGVLPQTSVLQIQNSELGDFDRKSSAGNAGSQMLGDIPGTLAKPSDPRKSTANGPLPSKVEHSPVPQVLQPAQAPSEASSPHKNTNQQSIPGTGARHESISVDAHSLSHAPSVLKPGGRRQSDSCPESQENQAAGPSHSPSQITQGSALSSRLSAQGTEDFHNSSHDGRPSATRVNTLPPKMNGSPGFLVFHEIPSASNPSNQGAALHLSENLSPKPAEKINTPPGSDSGQSNTQSQFSINDAFPAVTPPSFVERPSSKGSGKSSVTPETQDSSTPSGKLASTSCDDISEVISVISSFTPQGTPAPSSGPSQPPSHTAPEDSSEPKPNLVGEGASAGPDVAAGPRPPATSGQYPPQSLNVQQASATFVISGDISFTPANTPSKPTPAVTAPILQSHTALPSSNVGTAATQNTQSTQVSPPPIQGSLALNQKPPPSPPSQTGGPGKIPVSTGPLRPQGGASNTRPSQISAGPTSSPRPTSQPSNFAQISQSHVNQQVTQQPPQAQHANTVASHENSSAQVSTPSSMSQAYNRPQQQSNASIQSTTGSSAVGNNQTNMPRPTSQQPASAVSSAQQPNARPPVGYQTQSPPPAQNSPQLQHQHPSPVAQPVSPLQSQVSSPTQSIASVHVSQSSTPSLTFATTNNINSPGFGSNANIGQAAPAPVRPSSLPPHSLAQQAGNVKPTINPHASPSSPVGNTQAHQTAAQSNPPVKPYPMLPGQVTPLPSQVGSTPVPIPVQHQPITNNPVNPQVNAQLPAVGQQAMHTAPTSTSQQHVLPTQPNQQPQLHSMPNQAQGTAGHGPFPPQTQMRPPQQQFPSAPQAASHAGAHHPTANHPQLQQGTNNPSPAAPIQTYNPQTFQSSSAASTPAISQPMFAPPPTAQAQTQQLAQNPGVTSPTSQTPGKPFNSTQATEALTGAGKGVKKWAKKLWNNNTLKQSGAAIGGALIAESLGGNAVTGAQLANKIYSSTQRPPIIHAHTAPPQAHGIPGAPPTQQHMQMNQQYQPGKIQPAHPQLNSPQAGHMGHLQPGYPQPGHPQPGHPQTQPAHPQPGHPQPGHPQPGHPQPGHPQPGHPQPGHPQPGHPKPGHPQPGYPQPGHQQPGHPQPGHPQPGHPQPGHPQPGHPQPGHPQPGHPQPGHPHPGHPQPGHQQPGHPQPGHPQPGHPQPGHPHPGHPHPGHQQPGHQQPGHQQPGHQQPGHQQPGHQQPGHQQPEHPQPGHQQPGRPQSGPPRPGRPQPSQQPIGVQTPGRPPVVQNPAIAAGVAMNFNTQAQIGINQQQQYPTTRPAMAGNPPPPPPPPPSYQQSPPATVNFQAHGIQAQAQVNVDSNMAANAVLIGSAIGAAFRPNPSPHAQPQHAQGHTQGHAQPDYPSHAEPYGAEHHGHAAESHTAAHEPVHDSYSTQQAPATYTDNSYTAADTTYADNTSHAVNNTAYTDNTDIVNNIYVDNSTAFVTDTTYTDTSYFDNTSADVDNTTYVNSTDVNNTYIDNSAETYVDTTYVDTSYVDTAAYASTDATVDMNVEVDINSAVYDDGSMTTFSMEESIDVTSSSDFAVTSVDYSGGDWGDYE